MTEFVSANLTLIVIGALVALVVLWWAVMATRRTRVTIDRCDTLDEGADRAARNQALIDATPAASAAPIVPPAVPGAIAGAGAAVAAAVEEAALAATEPEAASTTGTGRDDLTRIKGLGPKLATTLGELGVTRFEQIAGWSDADIDRIDGQLGRFQGRIRRDDWVEQAKMLEAGDVAAFEARFGAQ